MFQTTDLQLSKIYSKKKHKALSNQILDRSVEIIRSRENIIETHPKINFESPGD